jgi:hypothetical protein
MRDMNLVHPGTTRTERTDEETARPGVAIDASGGSIPAMFQ